MHNLYQKCWYKNKEIYHKVLFVKLHFFDTQRAPQKLINFLTSKKLYRKLTQYDLFMYNYKHYEILSIIHAIITNQTKHSEQKHKYGAYTTRAQFHRAA